MNRSIQYLHIDFLRLFRLCRQLGYVNKKRKMPNEYALTPQAIDCCKRLLKTFLTKTFPEGTVSVSGSNVHVTFSDKHTNLLRGAIQKCNMAEKGKEIRQLFDEMCSNTNNYLQTHFYSYNKHISISTTGRTYYYRYDRYSGRTPHRFFEAAQAAIEFKQKWDVLIPWLTEMTEKDKQARSKPKTKRQKSATQAAFDKALAKQMGGLQYE